MYQINAKVTVRKGYNFTKSYYYILEIGSSVETILNDLSIMKMRFFNLFQWNILLMMEKQKGLIYESFMAVGSVNDPKSQDII